MTTEAFESLAYCGSQCDQCGFREKTNCPGCRAAGGKLFWGQCGLAVCCIAKGLEHCGKCDQFPCDQLKAYSFDKEHGDHGRRIENLLARGAALTRSGAADVEPGPGMETKCPST